MIEYTVKVYDCGTKEWFLSGKRHREDGPAIEYADGTKMWFLNGERHREDGPAIEWADGDKSWYLNGSEVTKQEVMQFSDMIVEIDGKKYTLEEYKDE